jgi:hypothetical protein
MRGKLPALGGFVVEFLTEDGVHGKVGLADAWPRCEAMSPVCRSFSRGHQRYLPGRWWSATDGHRVGYESWLERDHVVLLGFDLAVVGIASQPFWLSRGR